MALEAKIALSLENDPLATEFQLKPSVAFFWQGRQEPGRPPSEGLWLIACKSSFFLIDRTVIAASCDFYSDIGRIFDAAKRNAPSIVFIDDADVLFEDKDDTGLYATCSPCSTGSRVPAPSASAL